jgi:Protein-tyrosine-phosphatase
MPRNKILFGHITRLLDQQDQIDQQRLKLLVLIGDLIATAINERGSCDIITICTHNSRRSQLAEVWLDTACQYFNLHHIKSYSGGTEATAFNIRMVIAMRNLGFHLHTDGPKNNPKYVLQALEPKEHPHILFSKVYDHPFNPRENFMALMVCDHASEACPIVNGASHRISLVYRDPKEHDDSPMEYDAYHAKVEEIGREMLFLMQCVRQSL